MPTNETFKPPTKAQRGVFQELFLAFIVIISLISTFYFLKWYVLITVEQTNYLFSKELSLIIISTALLATWVFFYYPASAMTLFVKECELPEVFEAKFLLTIAKVDFVKQLDFICSNNIKIYIADKPLESVRVTGVKAKYYNLFRFVFKLTPQMLHSFYFSKLFAAIWGGRVCFIASEVEHCRKLKEFCTMKKLKIILTA